MSLPRRLRTTLPFVVILLGAAPTAAGQPPAPDGWEQPGENLEWVRVVRDDRQQPRTLETNVVRFTGTGPDGEPLVVDLVGAIHVGERAYYEQLNRSFADYEAVLYELVAPEGTRVPRGGRPPSGHPVSMLQGGLKSVLELDHQLEVIDYTAAHFVHADMTPDEFARSMRERGEGFWQLLFSALGQAAAMQGDDPGRSLETRLLRAMFSRDRPRELKRVLADQFEDLESQLALFDGPDGSTIITERNQKALDVLSRQIGEGKRTVAIFYGAGHMPDMSQRLQEQFQLEPVGVRWLTAWQMQ